MNDDRLVRVLKALAEPKRFRMVQTLVEAGELSCGQLGESFNLAQPTISHHVKILTDAGLLLVREEGQHHFISVDVALLRQVSALMLERLTKA